MSIAASAASAKLLTTEFNHWVVSGGITDKALNQTITLPSGSEFNGLGKGINLLTEEGEIEGTVTVPAFTADLKILGQSAATGITFKQVGVASGGFKLASTEPAKSLGEVTLSIPAKVNIGFTSLSILGITIPTECVTSSPVSFPLMSTTSLLALLYTGTSFKGTTTIPSVSCGGLFGILLQPILSSLVSGSNNAYSLSFAPPAS